MDVGRDELVVEIGAGWGRLTAELAPRAGSVVAIELDVELASRLARRFARRTGVTVVRGDALREPLPSLPFRAVGNIPFHLTAAMLRRLLDDPRTPLERADLIVEWGVACKRAATWPSTLLGIRWGAWYEFAVVRRLPARCFEPRPPVDAGVLRVVRRRRPLVSPAEAHAFRALVETAFRSREASLRVALGGQLPPRRLRRLGHELGFEPSDAPRELDVHQWAALHRAVRAAR